MSRFKWVALACATVVALAAVTVPGANSASNPGLKVTSVFKSSNPSPVSSASQVAKCPKHYTVVGGGFEKSSDFEITDMGRLTKNKWLVNAFPKMKAKGDSKRGTFLGAQAICVKGTGGFDVSTDDSGIPAAH